MAAWGPFAAGWIYDRSGDYRLAWWLGAGFNALALLLLAFTRPPAAAAAERAVAVMPQQ
jgi:cyanate permease